MEDINEICILLHKCNDEKPREIHRSIRTLECLSFWKGTEFRAFLLYIGPVILKDYLQPIVYKHFLQLFCAVTICTAKVHSHYLHIAESLFNDFIDGYIEIYGKDTISSNVHNLCHVVDDIKRFGELMVLNAYPFENQLYSIKKLLRSGNLPLSQIAKRLEERIQHNVSARTANYPYLEREIKKG